MFYRKILHCITALAILASAIAPSITQAISVATTGQGLVMEICVADGSKLALDVQTNNESEVMPDCPHCVAPTPLAIALLISREFQVPDSHVLIPPLYFQSPKPLFVWIKLPSHAPPLS